MKLQKELLKVEIGDYPRGGKKNQCEEATMKYAACQFLPVIPALCQREERIQDKICQGSIKHRIVCG